ncbi:MAG: hypothetical protein Q7S21_04165 [archaeon]|nr:hypothetical protein [archaeon]
MKKSLIDRIEGKRVRRKLGDHYVTLIVPEERISWEEAEKRIKKIAAKMRANNVVWR